MNEQAKKTYLEKYHKAKEEGVPFFPDILFKDAVVSLFVFLVLVALAYLVGAPLEARANPADTTYTPRPEWYFLFLFQLLKYFPGRLEVIGVVVLPSLVIALLFLLPFIDRSPRRHFRNRPVVAGATALAVTGIVALTILAVSEAPPPAVPASGDQTAALYVANCAPCHGSSITVPPGTNLHQIIAGGGHAGMPAWGADLSSDQIDALAGFILSPAGSQLFTQYCNECHAADELVASNPLELKKSLDLGLSYPPHAGIGMLNFSTAMDAAQRARLLNFLIAPDGQRLFTINCSPCHGTSVAYSGTEEELRRLISKGGLHREMPSWKEKLTSGEIELLARYVVDPRANPGGKPSFEANCKRCHGERIPSAASVEQARETITTGSAHQTMPVWGEILTAEQLDALVKYTLESGQGRGSEAGAQLFAANCAPCHGPFGEGGPNPTRPGDIIAPISSAEFLKTRDDLTLRNIISQGQPTFGMSPFGAAYGGPLSDEQIDALVAFIRSWQANPPVELPPEVSPGQAAISGAQIYEKVCAQCHGTQGEGGTGPAFNTPEFRDKHTDAELFDVIDHGREATPMIAWGEILTTEQIQQLVSYVHSLSPAREEATPGAPIRFSEQVLPILQEKCSACHNQNTHLGGWDASTYATLIASGDHAPVIVPGDPTHSLLAQKLLGTQEEGMVMPPGGKLPDDLIQIILDWIKAGAPER